MTLLDGGAQHGVLPVCTLAQCGNISVGVATLIAEVVLLVLCPLRGGEQVEFLGYVTHTQGVMIVHVSLTLAQLTFLSGDKDYAIGAARTIDSSGRYVLQDFNTLDVVGVDGGQGIQAALDSTDTCAVVGCILEVDKAINYVKRFIRGIHGVTTTDADMTIGTRLSTTCCHSQTCHLSA